MALSVGSKIRTVRSHVKVEAVPDASQVMLPGPKNFQSKLGMVETKTVYMSLHGLRLLVLANLLDEETHACGESTR